MRELLILHENFSCCSKVKLLLNESRKRNRLESDARSVKLDKAECDTEKQFLKLKYLQRHSQTRGKSLVIRR